MKTIDFSPLYSSSIGFDRLASLLDQSLRHNQSGHSYPPYNIERVDDNHYTLTLAVAGFDREDLDIQVENGELTVKGKGIPQDDSRTFLHQGIATRGFERRFNLADFVEVKGASLDKGMLTIELVKEIPEAMKPRSIKIGDDPRSIEHEGSGKAA